LDLLGPQLGRLTLATVIDLDASVEHDRAKEQARVELLRRADQIRMRLWTPLSGSGRARPVRSRPDPAAG
jgi:hypothetical protein